MAEVAEDQELIQAQQGSGWAFGAAAACRSIGMGWPPGLGCSRSFQRTGHASAYM